MKIETHPFNDTHGLSSINYNTRKLILGTFPAFQVTSKGKPRLEFYYGSTDNKFWDLFSKILPAESEFTAENVLKHLSSINFGIIDIIRKCYRKDNQSSSDEELCIIEFQDMIDLLSKTKIDTIYTTSELVTKLLKQQIKPLLDKNSSTQKGKRKTENEIFIPLKQGDFEFVEVELPSRIFKIGRQLKIKTLYSPSDQGLRGISKGIKSKKLETDAITHRQEQYRQLLLA